MGWVVSVTPRPRFTPGENTPGTHCTGGWVGPRAGLDTEDRGKILCPWRGSNPDRPVVQPVVRHYTMFSKVISSIHVFFLKLCRLCIFHPTASCMIWSPQYFIPFNKVILQKLVIRSSPSQEVTSVSFVPLRLTTVFKDARHWFVYWRYKLNLQSPTLRLLRSI
jgi:hypothetical protein